MALNIETFKTRAITALVFVVIMLSGILINGYLFIALSLTIMLGCLYEFFKMYQIIYSKKDIKLVWSSLLYIILPIIILLGLGCSYSFKSLIINNKYQSYIPCLIFFSIWINDTMAYMVGSFIGKTPFSKISPKKTWEGTIGGVILCVLIIHLGTEFIFHDSQNLFRNTIIAAICGIFGTFGDLLESKLKRMANIKDSGSIMPGHGGFLDRFDSLLLALPAVFLYQLIFSIFSR